MILSQLIFFYIEKKITEDHRLTLKIIVFLFCIKEKRGVQVTIFLK